MIKVAVTGGHLTPALATIEELRKKDKVEIVFFGRAHAMEGEKAPSAESVIIKQLKIPFYAISAGRLQRRFTEYTIPAFLRTPWGLFQALTILLKEKPDVILSFGGYIALPVVYAGWLLRIPAITHEQTTSFGLANKLISLVARKIALTWEDTEKNFPKNKIVLTGLPLRGELLQIKKKKTTLPIIYITGGNQGSHLINQAIKEILSTLLDKYIVFHQSGDTSLYKDFDSLKVAVSDLPTSKKRRYRLAKWFNLKELQEIYSRTSLVISRAGANTVFELAAVGVPSILIPISWSQKSEQTRNALILQNLKAAIILPEEELTSKRLLQAINIVMKDLSRFRKQAKTARKLVKSEAALSLAEETLKLAEEK